MEDFEMELIADDDLFKRQTEILMAKHGLHDVCFQEIINFADATNPPLAGALRKLCSVHAHLFQTFAGVVQSMRPFYAGEFAKLKRDAEQAEADAAELFALAETLEQEARVHHAEMARARAEYMAMAMAMAMAQ